MRGYNPSTHSYVIFDNVNDMKFILDYRAMFQANNDIHTLGDNKTGCYSYDVWLWRVPIVVTIDMSAEWDQQDPWIQANSIHVFLEGQSWVERIEARLDNIWRCVFNRKIGVHDLR